MRHSINHGQSTLDDDETMREYLPVFRQYLRRKAELLGHKDGLPQYDLVAPLGAGANLRLNTRDLSSRTSQLSVKNSVNSLIKHSDCWIDVYPRKGNVVAHSA